MLTLKSYKSFEALLRLQIYWVFKSKLHVRRIHAKINHFGLNFLLTPKQQRHNQRLQTLPAAHRTSQIILSDERKQGIYCGLFSTTVTLLAAFCTITLQLPPACGWWDGYLSDARWRNEHKNGFSLTNASHKGLFILLLCLCYYSSRMRKEKNLLSLYQPRAFGLVLVVGRSVCEGAGQVC